MLPNCRLRHRETPSVQVEQSFTAEDGRGRLDKPVGVHAHHGVRPVGGLTGLTLLTEGAHPHVCRTSWQNQGHNSYHTEDRGGFQRSKVSLTHVPDPLGLTHVHELLLQH